MCPWFSITQGHLSSPPHKKCSPLAGALPSTTTRLRMSSASSNSSASTSSTDERWDQLMKHHTSRDFAYFNSENVYQAQKMLSGKPHIWNPPGEIAYKPRTTARKMAITSRKANAQPREREPIGTNSWNGLEPSTHNQHRKKSSVNTPDFGADTTNAFSKYAVPSRQHPSSKKVLPNQDGKPISKPN